MRRLLTNLILLGLLSGIVPMMPAGAQTNRAGEIVRLVNELRASKGLWAYCVDATLMAVAQAQAEWSAANNHIGHDGPGGSMPMDRALAGGYGGGRSIFIRENAAHGTTSYNTPELVVTMWQGDDVHLETLISARHDDVGVGYAEAGGNSWYVMMVGRIGTGEAATSQPQSKETPLTGGAPAALFHMNTPGPDGSLWHEMQTGQTAWTVAAYYGIDLQELLALNNLTETSVLRPGDMLLIRPPLVAASATATWAQSTGTLTATQASTITPSPILQSEESADGGPPIVILGLLVAAIAVLVGSGARAAYILRRWRTNRSADE